MKTIHTHTTSGWRLSLLVSMLTSAFSSQAFSEEDKPSLPPVVVTATRTAQLQSEALLHTTVITAQQIRDSQATDLPSLLSREAGVQITQSGGVGSASGMFLRGADTRQTLVVIDGVPMTKQDATGTVSIEHMMLDQIDRVEIVRGNVSSIYGSGAVGGVIQIFTKASSGAPGFSSSVEVGSRNTQRMSASSRGTSDGFSYGLVVSEYFTKGFSAINTRQYSLANPDRDGYRNQSVSGSLAKTWSDGHEIGMRFMNAVGKADYDSGYALATDRHDSRTEVSSYSVYSNDRLTDQWTSRLSVSDLADDYTNREYSTTTSRSRYQSRTQVAEWSNEFVLSSQWRATAGTNRQWQRFTSDAYGSIDEYQRAAYSVFGGLQGTIERHQWQLNARQDEIGSLSATTGYAGYGFQLDPKLKLIASLSNAFSAPPLGYLYGAYGNSSLKPEYSRSVEAGVQYSDGPSILRATVFETRTNDQFQWVTTDITTGDGQLRNVKKTRNQGIELSATHYYMNWEWRAGLTLQEPIDLSTEERLTRRPAVLGSLGATTKVNQWRIGGDVSYTGSRSDTSTLAAYWLANATARYQVDKKLSIFGRIENLFDADYQTAWGYNQARRGVFVGLNWQP
jgi:vitamin B12 transporter